MIKVAIKWILGLAAVIWVKCHQQNDLIVDFFADIKRIDYCVVFTCDKYQYDSVDLLKRLSKNNIRIAIVHSMENKAMSLILTHHRYGASGVVVNCACDNYAQILDQASEQHFFNLSHEWLILDPLNLGLDTILNPVLNININSQITFVGPGGNGEPLGFHLTDVYSRGRHLVDRLMVQTYATWIVDRGFTILQSFPSLYHKQYRGNLENLTLTAGLVIDRENVRPKDVDRIFSEQKRPEGVSPFGKHYYVLMKIMAEKYNFSLYFKRIARDWSGRLPSGYRLGILGAIARAEVDIGATGMFNIPNRHDEYDVYHSSWEFEVSFFYRVTPEVIKSQSSANFLSPFAASVWLLIAIMVLTVILVLKVTFIFFSDSSESAASLFVQSISAIAQQGVHLTTTNLQIRIIFFTLVVTTFLLYNYYSSIVVSNLLSENVHGPETVPEIIDSKLKMAFVDISYHKIMFKEKKFQFVEEIYRKKIAGRNASDIYKDVVTGVQLMKTGEYVFHGEGADVNPVIAKCMDAKEMCDLRIVPGLFPKVVLGLFQPKRSQYTEMLKIAVMRLQEVGLVARSLRHTRAAKLVCRGTITIHPLTLTSVSTAFLILSGGLSLAVALLVCEQVLFQWIYRRTKLKPVKNDIYFK